MATKIGEAYAELTVRDDKYKSGLDKAKKDLGSFGEKTKGITKGIGGSFSSLFSLISPVAIGFTTLTVGIAKATKAASDFEEINNRFTVVFKDVAEEAEKTADSLSKSFGLSSGEARDLLSNTGDLLTGFGFTGKAALDLSEKTNKLAADLASFTKIEGGTERASKALTKALLGERESAKELGISIMEEDVQARLAAEGKDKLTGLALRQAKAEVTLALAMEQSKNAIGNFARSSDSYANQARTITSLLKDLSVTVGKPLVEAFKGGQKSLLDNQDILREMAQVVVKIIGVFTTLMGIGQRLWKSLFEPLANALSRGGSAAKTMGAALDGISKIFLDIEPVLQFIVSLIGEAIAFLYEFGKVIVETVGPALQSLWEGLKSASSAIGEFIDEVRGITHEEVIIEVLADDEPAKKKIQNFNSFRQEASKATATKIKENEEDLLKKRLELAEAYMSSVMGLSEAINEIFNVDTQNRLQEIDQRREKQTKQLDDTFNKEKQNILDTVKNKKKADKLIEKLEEDKAKKQEAIDEKADKQKKKLQREEFKRNQGIQIANALMNTAGAIMNALTTTPFPVGLAFSLLAAATGAAQVAAIAAQKPPAMADGGIVTKSTLAEIGEAGTEAVFPLQGSRGRRTTQMFAEDLISAIGSQSEIGQDRRGTLDTPTGTMTFNVQVNVGNERLFSQITQGIENREILIDERSLVRR